MGTPAYKAGLDKGDIIDQADGSPVADMAALNALVVAKKPGDKLVITYHNRAGQHTVNVVLAEYPFVEVAAAEQTGDTLTKEQETFRNNWLSSKVK